MAFLSHSKKEIKAKIVYYGPGLSGKTSNIEYIHNKMRSDHRGDLVNLSTSDRTLFFDFLPVELGNIKGYRTRFHIFTVPGQVFYNETRKKVMKDVDGIVFVADSQKKMRDENVRSLKNLEENLAFYNKSLQEIPHVFQYNKRDLPGVLSIEELHRLLNKTGAPFFEAVATQGNGILNTLKLISKMVLKKLATAPANSIEESDEAFEENNYGLSDEYEVVAPGDDVEDKETVVTAMEIEIPMGEAVEEEGGEVAMAVEVGEEVEAAQAEPEEDEVNIVETEEEAVAAYEAVIQNEVDESEIPPPPEYSEPVEEAEPVMEAEPVYDEPPAPPARAAAAKPAGAPAKAATAAKTAAPGARELVLYQWGFPDRIDDNTIKIPLMFRDAETGEEYSSFITISLDNILKKI